MKSTRYWLSIGDGKSYGPYSLTELQGFKKDGRLSAQTQLCDESSTQWVAASSVITDFVLAMPRTDSDAPTKWTPSLSDVAPMGVAPDAPAREATKWPPPPNSDIAELRANADPAITAPTKWLPLGLFSPILLTLCCCLVGGIVTIVYTTSANAKGAAGDIEGAKADAARAARWQFWSTVVGACLFLLVQAVKFSRL